MLNFIKKYTLLLRQDFWLFAILSIPGLVFYFIGLYQLDAINWFTITVGTINKFAIEFLTISVLFCLMHVLGFKKRWFFAIVIFLYYITITADIVLLAYFKERFGLKYLLTLGGAQYQFMLDFRLILYFVALYLFPYIVIKKNWHKSSRHASAKKIAVSAILLLIIALASPLNYIKGNDVFFASQLMDTTVAGIFKDIIAKKYPYQEYTKLPEDVQAAADKYNLFKPTEFTNKNTYDRIILITTEAFSNKFISSFNPAIPKAASDTFDNLVTQYPFASLKSVTLSTLYGLSVVFSGHPNAELSFKNKFPISFVKILRENGFNTVFIRGADEEYMDEHIVFKEAGFNEVYGAKYFEQIPKYSNYVSWWGLTDRKLFDYTTNYLKEHKNDKVFINILTVDTHVPTGRIDYLDEEFPEIKGEDVSKKIGKLYTRPNMPRAFAHYNYDLGLFISDLKKEGLLDERTLLVVTADHPFYANVDTGDLFKNYKPVFNEVPLIFISEKPIKEAVSYDLFKSQQDIAPTILGLAGFAAPKGMFGRSIFEKTDRTVFNLKSNYVIIKNTKGTRVIPFSSNKLEDKAVLGLLNATVSS